MTRLRANATLAAQLGRSDCMMTLAPAISMGSYPNRSGI